VHVSIPPPRPTTRVIVVDDDDEHRAWLVHRLRMEGLVVHHATSGRELLDMLHAVRPGYFDAVICDQLMPGLRGTECLALAGSRSHFLIITGSRDEGIDAAAKQFGAAAVVRKPLDAAALADLVHSTCRRSPRHVCA